ncbi:hypothetical protein [Terriglobus tenax]|uniref:hypothetical protein n=1 Tax=Terriglobus tenax TaxID=1111115 RepID=UPI0021DFD61C|nr:hypothetical protein [Terriglobus tenax]
MFRSACATVALVCTLLSSATLRSEVPEQYSRKELKSLIQSARSPEQYAELSRYFHNQAHHFKNLAAVQEAAMERELNHTSGAKYPSGYESALHLRDYYNQRAAKFETMANSYDRLLKSF